MAELKDDLAALRIEREPERPGAARWVVWLFLLIGLLAIGFAGWRWFTREQPIEVQAATVSERAAGTSAAVLNASGYVTARRRATVSSKVTGKVIEVNVEEGMHVKEGQILARLDDTQAHAALALAEAQAKASAQQLKENEVHLAQAKITLNRAQSLLKSGAGMQADVDTAQTDVDGTAARIGALQEMVRVADRQVDVQKTELDNTIIRAPFGGIAISKDAQPGEMVSPVSAGGGFTRTGICTIVDMGSLEIDVDVNESYINRVKPDQPATAILDAYPDWQIPAEVITIVPTADRQKATVQVRIRFKKLDPRILPDMGIKVTFLREDDTKGTPVASARPAILVPRAAVAADAAGSAVFVIRGEIVERRAVRTGGTDGDRVEVIGQLSSGERVVLTPPSTLKDGMRIVVK